MIPASAYDFWLFDLDGTLVDVEWSYMRSVFDELGEQLDHRFTDTDVRILWHGLTGSRNNYLRDLGVDIDRFWEALFHAEDPEVRAEATYLHDDAAVLAELDQPIGVVTHCQPYLTGPVLDRLDITDWFDMVVCCDEALGWKPDPAPVELIMDHLGVMDQQGVLVGDSPGDIGAAWNAGLDAVHIERHSPHFRGDRVVADYRIRRLTSITHRTQDIAAD